MKIERKKDQQNQCGIGSVTFESDLFRVMTWKGSGRIYKTTIEIIYHFDTVAIELDGNHTFTSDMECVAQMNADEILRAFEEMKRQSFIKGRRAKAREIREALEIESF